MKPLCIIMLLAMPILSFSQIDSSFYKDGKVTYWAVNKVDTTLGTQDLMRNFNLWWADYCNKFNSAIVHEQWKLRESVIEKTDNSVVVKGRFRLDQILNTSMWVFDLTIQCKDGRYKYTITNIGNTANNTPFTGRFVNDFIAIETMHRPMTEGKVSDKITGIIFSLEDAMRKKPISDNF